VNVEEAMDSPLANDLRRQRREQLAQMTPGQRVRLALLVGTRDLRIFASAQGMTLAEARDEIRRRGQRGRVPSAAAGR
jgi:hypothetical protein